jgi:hypothetical protein
MIITDKLSRSFEPTQLAGAAILATLLLQPATVGPLDLAQAMGFESLTAALIVAVLCWLFLFQLFLPCATPLSLQQMPRWPKFFQIMADPTVTIGNKIKTIFTNWFGWVTIIGPLAWIAKMVFEAVL